MKLYKLFIIAFGAWFSILSSPVTADTILSGEIWTDITVVDGLEPGQAVTLQNTGRTTLRVVTAKVQPVSFLDGLLIPPDQITYDARPVGENHIWILNTGTLDGSVNIVTSMTVTPSNAIGAPLDFEVELAAGRIPGKSRILKFGERATLPGSTGVFATIWDGPTDTYVPPTQSRIHDISSDSIEDVGLLISSGAITTESISLLIDSNADFISDGVVIGDSVINDTDCIIAVAGVLSVDSATQLTVFRMVSPATGVPGPVNNVGDGYRIVRATATGAGLTYVQGIGSDRLENNEFVINNGLSNVPTLTSYIRQFRMRAFAGGSLHKAVGTISSTAKTDATVSAVINDGTNQTLMAVYTVPLNKIGYIKFWRAALTRKQSAASAVRLRTGLLDGINYVSRSTGLTSLGNGDFENPMFGFILPPGVDVWIEADSDSPNTGVSGGFDIILEDI